MKTQSVLLIFLMWALVSSCVHREFEYPAPDTIPGDCEVALDLRYFDLEMPPHTILDLDHSRSASETSAVSRHIIKVYDSSGAEAASALILDNPDRATTARRHRLTLSPGSYTAVCWTDFTLEDESDWHYDSSDFPRMELRGSYDSDGFLVHSANTMWRDAFCGRTSFRVLDNGSVESPGAESGAIPVEMRRPMARFIFEATDLTDFAESQALTSSSGRNASETLSDYTFLFRYSEYMPSVFNTLRDVPVDSRVGASFVGVPRVATSGSGAVELGSDFVFVHPQESAVNVALEIRKSDSGTVVARAGPVTVPLFRNRLTIVRGKFLTSSSGSGIVIDTGFYGDYNIGVR